MKALLVTPNIKMISLSLNYKEKIKIITLILLLDIFQLMNIIPMLSTQLGLIFLCTQKKELNILILVQLKTIKLLFGFRAVLALHLSLEIMKKSAHSELTTKLNN